jgi:lipid A 3-O-deacylase
MRTCFVNRRFKSIAADIIRLYWIAIASTLLFSAAHAQPVAPSTNALSSAGELSLEPAPKGIWENGVGEGFLPGARSFTVSAGANYGIATFGSEEQHHLALISLEYGHMLGHTLGQGHWYRGNPQFRLELFGGAQFSPSTESLIGLAPHLRYNFATGTPWIPFFDLGAGVSATSIGPPDLSGTFEFNLQAATGIQWFVKPNMALSLEVRYLHMSCGGIHRPNQGLNGITGMLGVTFFF